MSPTKQGLPEVVLVVAVVSVRPERRQAIRNSWLSWGDERVEVRFFTEAPAKSDPDFEATSAVLQAELDAHVDLVFMDIDRGMNFALKLVFGQFVGRLSISPSSSFFAWTTTTFSASDVL